ncbi:MAG: hypothetical protein NC038_03110 [Paludibacter sp.]|nr:hypothetical protein [Bacteroidales bacterium]MCM1069140.1 hypothetical protein [Prevotella sp.]MCM1353579.1 hypothetical protein [Bacteroides sp.]MCM1442740.1 hypothetical protein [Muribaculum sp.]MCM1481624.1 hypothetical protein [Paludibacter sp.]
MKKSVIIAVVVLLNLPAVSIFGREHNKTTRQERVEKVKSHVQVYGFVRNYFSFDTRENVVSIGDLYNYLPKDARYNQTPEEAALSGVAREDLNAQYSFRYLSLTTRLGVDVNNYKWGNTAFTAKVEADFCAGLTGVTGTAQFRLRQAYVALAWDSLAMGQTSWAHVRLLLGQTWHPMSADMPDILSLNSGAPFNPFNRSPQVQMNALLGQYFIITAAALWQMQYTSMGPKGASADYMKYGCTPEAYLGVSFAHPSGVLLRAGVDVLSIKPRHEGTMLPLGNPDKPVTVKVSDRITTISPYLYLQYKYGNFSLKAKTIFAEGGEHLNLNGGYGIHAKYEAIGEDGHYEYTPTRNSSSWLCLTYGKRVQGILFAGYVRNFGTKQTLLADTETDAYSSNLYFSKNSFTNMNRLWRLTPTVLWNIGNFSVGAEYELTSVQYGMYPTIDGTTVNKVNATNGLLTDNLHWITNHRVQLMVKYTF